MEAKDENRRRVKRKCIPRDMFVVEHGTDMFVCRYLSTVFRAYGINSDRSRRQMSGILQKQKVWIGMDGFVRIRRVKQVDYKPPKWSKEYKESIIE